MLAMGADKESWAGGVTYFITKNEVLAKPYIPVAIEKKIDIQDYPLWLRVPDAVVDDYVPADWPDATDLDENDETQKKKFWEYTPVKRGINGESLVRMNHFPGRATADNTFSSTSVPFSPEETDRYLTLVSGDVSKVVYGSILNQWLADNTAQESP